MKESIDLHVHSTCSDGTLTPGELVELAVRKKLRAFALTDHDTTEGIEEALQAAKGTGVLVIPGIEFSTSYEKKDVHILGLNLDYKSAYFQEQLEEFRDSRALRNRKMIRKLREHGIAVTWEDMQREYPDSVWTRAHFAAFLQEHGYVGSKNEAFDRYLGDRACCFVQREKVTPWQAVRLIHETGGLAVLAHPLLYGFSQEKLETLVADLKKAGLDGIEAIYSSNRPAETRYCRQLAIRQGLAITGGSDFHGSNKPNLEMGTGYGNLQVPYSVWENLIK